MNGLFKKLSPSNDQIWKIISESFLSTPLSQNGVWNNGMTDLDSERTGTNIDSRNWLKSSKGSGVKICSVNGSKSRNSFSLHGMWLYKSDRYENQH